MKTVVLLLTFFINVFAANISILDFKRSGEVAEVKVKSIYRMSERESIEEVRLHVLENQKRFAVEYTGNIIVSATKVESVGDGAVTRQKKYMSKIVKGATSSEIIQEALNEGSEYEQTANIVVDLSRVSDGLLREAKIDSILKSNLYKSESSVTKDETQSFNQERAELLYEFSLAVKESIRPTCQLEKQVTRGNKTTDTYVCQISPTRESVANFYEYYNADICMIPMKKNNSLKKIVSNENRDRGGLISNNSVDVSFYDMEIEFDVSLPCSVKWVSYEMFREVSFSVYGYSSQIFIPVIRSGVPIRTAFFRIDHTRYDGVVSGVNTLQLKVGDSMVLPIQFDPSFSL